MRRVICIGTALLALWGVTGVAAAPAAPPPARLRAFVCQKALDPGARAISVTAVMRPVAGTAKLAMRFALLRRAGRRARAVSVTAHGLKAWITPSDPTLGQRPGDVWVVHHPVVDLSAPAFYRFRVSFRWTDATGTVLDATVLRSVRCFQPELRPDLAVPDVKIMPTGVSGMDRYVVVVANRGRSASGPFALQLTLGAAPSEQLFTQAVPTLAPHTRMTVPFRAPACTAAEQITAVADPGPPLQPFQVDDVDRANNTWAATCPGPTTPVSARRSR